MKKNNKLHTFVICAYKESPYLEESIKSLKKQLIESEIIISTSTPNELIKKIAKKYKLKLAINKNSDGCIDDFSFAYDQAKTKYVTLCHQDDIYLPNYSEKVIKKMEKHKDSLLLFTNYYELRYTKIKKYNLLLIVKRIMNFPFKIGGGKFKRIRKFILSLGNPICAPTVTFNKEKIKEPWKISEFKLNLDWDTWLDISDKYKGRFMYINKPLLYKRINEDSITSLSIKNNIVSKENYLIFKRYWPEKIAKILTKIYGQSEKSNRIEKRR